MFFELFSVLKVPNGGRGVNVSVVRVGFISTPLPADGMESSSVFDLQVTWTVSVFG